MTARAAGVAASAVCVAAGPAPPAEKVTQGLGRASAVCVAGGPAPHPGKKLEKAILVGSWSWGWLASLS